MPETRRAQEPRHARLRWNQGHRDADDAHHSAGTIGNEQPIVITSERWFSPELQLVIYAARSTRARARTSYRLTNLKRGEPPADLFKVPRIIRFAGAGVRTRPPATAAR
jgi:hypothetical protein